VSRCYIFPTFICLNFIPKIVNWFNTQQFAPQLSDVLFGSVYFNVRWRFICLPVVHFGMFSYEFRVVPSMCCAMCHVLQLFNNLLRSDNITRAFPAYQEADKTHNGKYNMGQKRKMQHVTKTENTWGGQRWKYLPSTWWSTTRWRPPPCGEGRPKAPPPTSCGPASIFSTCLRMYFLLWPNLVFAALAPYSMICVGPMLYYMYGPTGAQNTCFFSFPVLCFTVFQISQASEKTHINKYNQGIMKNIYALQTISV